MLQAVSTLTLSVLLLQSVSFRDLALGTAGPHRPRRCAVTAPTHHARPCGARPIGSVSLDPPDLEIGYLEQGLSYSDADTLDDVVQVRGQALAKAEAEVARLAATLAANDNADGLEASDRLDAYGEALARMIRLVESLPAEHEVSAALASLDLGHLRWTLRLGISVGARRLAWGWRACYSASTTCSLLDEPTSTTSTSGARMAGVLVAGTSPAPRSSSLTTARSSTALRTGSPRSGRANTPRSRLSRHLHRVSYRKQRELGTTTR